MPLVAMMEQLLRKLHYYLRIARHIGMVKNRLVLEWRLVVILMKVKQKGGIACHTGRESCFYQRYENGQWQSVEPVLKDPKEIYKVVSK